MYNFRIHNDILIRFGIRETFVNTFNAPKLEIQRNLAGMKIRNDVLITPFVYQLF